MGRVETHRPLATPITRRPVHEIAQDIRFSMPKGTSTWTFCKPYVEALETLERWDEDFGADSAREIGLRFLCNAAGWRGERAKALKDEIREALGVER